MSKPEKIRGSSRGKKSRMKKKVHRAKAWVLTKAFLKKNLSMAGIPSIVKAKSKPRRFFWTCLILTIASFTAYTTSSVIQEYLTYPKKLAKKDSVTAALEFPAVTICSLNRIRKKQFPNSSIEKLMHLSDFAAPDDSLSEVKVDVKEINECFLSPMCYWSKFYERCFCLKSPCDTEFCFRFQEDICKCAGVLCEGENAPWQTACSWHPGGFFRQECMCSNNFSYARQTPIHEVSEESRQAVKNIDDSNIREAAQLILEAETNNLSDLDEDLWPSFDDIVDKGVKFKTMVISCSFEAKQCSRGDFTAYYDGIFGKCFMYNYIGDNDRKGLRIANYGSHSGLQLYLQIDPPNDIVDIFTSELGVRVTIHDPHELPPLLEEGINIAHSVVTNIEISLSRQILLSTPQSPCTEDWVHDFGEDTLKFIGKYTSLLCQKLCLLQRIQKMCHCLKRAFLPGKIFARKTKEKIVFCNTKDATHEFNSHGEVFNIHCRKRKSQHPIGITLVACVNRVFGELMTRPFPCKCPPRCSRNIYDVSTSNAILNPDFLEQIQRAKTLHQKNDSKWYYTSGVKLSTLTGLQVYYKTLQVESLCEEFSYSWQSLVSNIGGNCGFFMGFTVVTIFEIAEFVLDILTSFCCKSEKNFSKRRKSEGGNSFLRPDTEYLKNYWISKDNVRVLQKLRNQTQDSRLTRRRSTVRGSSLGMVRKPSLISPNYYLGGLYV